MSAEIIEKSLPTDEELSEEVCKFCGGSGEVGVMEQVWAGEPHTAMIGSQPCVCQIDDSDMSGAE